MDSSPAADPDAKDWRYVILPKTYYPTPASVATNYPKMFDFKGTAFTFSGTERMTELEKFIVVERDLR